MKDYFRFYKNNKFGVKDNQGNIILKPIYDYIWLGWVYYGFIMTRLNDKWGLFDLQGNTLLDTIYESIGLGDVSECFIQVKLSDKYGLFNKAGNQLLPVKYDWGTDLVKLYKNRLKIKEELLKTK